MSPARTSAPAVTGFYAGRAPQGPAAPPVSLAAGTLPWPGNPALGYIPVGYAYAPGYPGSLADGSALVIASNTTYSFYNFPAGVVLGAGVTGATFKGCRFTSSGGVSNECVYMNNTPANNGISFSYCTFEPAGFFAPPPGGVTLAQSYQFAVFAGSVTGLKMDHCDIWGFGNAVYADGSTQASPHVFSTNWIHDACPDNTYHTDGIGLPGGGSASYVQITGNQVNSTGNTNGLAYQVVVSGGGSSSWDHFSITGNLIGGFGYTIQLLSGTITTPAAATNTTFTGNTFTTLLECTTGPLYDNTFIFQPNWYWRNNRWLVPAGAWWGHSQYSGYYWIPGFTSNASPTLDELAAGLVSTTDYTG